MAGDDDPLIPLINMRLLAWRIPNSELHIIDDGHLFLVTLSLIHIKMCIRDR